MPVGIHPIHHDPHRSLTFLNGRMELNAILDRLARMSGPSRFLPLRDAQGRDAQGRDAQGRDAQGRGQRAALRFAHH